MRLAHLVCRFPPYAGGMGGVAYEQTTRLVSLGHEVTVFTLGGKERLDNAQLNFHVHYLATFPRLGNAGFCPEILWLLKNFDMIILHYPFFGAQEFLWLIIKLGLYKGQLIIFYHMDAVLPWYLKIFALKSILIRANLFKSAVKICSASLDYVKHSSLKKIYAQLADRFVELPFGSNQTGQLIDPLKLKNLRQALNLTPADKIVLFVGNLDSAHYFKGVAVLIDAVKKINDQHIRLVIVGDGDLREDYEKEALGLNISERVIFVGWVSPADLPYYYSLGDVTVLPSINMSEAFGLTLIEAKTYGKPVIGSNLPGVRDIVGPAGLLVRPGDALDLAEKIRTLLTDDDLAHRLGALGKQEVAEKYNWAKHVGQLNEIILKGRQQLRINN